MWRTKPLGKIASLFVFFPNSRLGKTYLEEGCTGEGGSSGRLDAAVNFERAMSLTRTGQKVIIIIITNE